MPARLLPKTVRAKKASVDTKRDAIRIFRPSWSRIGESTGSQFRWYFLDSQGQRIRCRSGYEALFGTYLTANGIPFEYEGLALGLTGKALYQPDFFLTMQGEFVELKGRPGNDNQGRSISLLRRKGFVIHVLEWQELRNLLGLPFKDYQTLLNRARASGHSVENYFASMAWLPTIAEEEVRDIQKFVFGSSLHKPIRIDKDWIRLLRSK